MAELNKITNIEEIKSLYIIKEVFSFLSKKQKLNMIIYNKKLQKLLLVDIEDYKKISGKYKIGTKNGNGKEFILNTNHLIFEEEYLNRKRNGKGKEYYESGKLEFEGEFLNGERNGKGKEGDGYYAFEGEYLNGLRNGKGKDYLGDKLIFEGEYLYGQKYKGKYYVNNKLEYEGEYLYNKKWNGKGYDEEGNIIYELNNGNGKVKEYDYDGILIFEWNKKQKRKGI